MRQHLRPRFVVEGGFGGRGETRIFAPEGGWLLRLTPRFPECTIIRVGHWRFFEFVTLDRKTVIIESAYELSRVESLEIFFRSDLTET